MSRRPTSYWCSVDDLRSDLAHRSRSGTRWMAVSTAARSVIEALSILVLARLLAPEAFGVVGMATAVTGFVGLFKDVGLSTATIQSERLNPDQLDRLFWINAIVSLLLASIVFAMGPLAALYFDEPKLTHVFFLLSSSFVLEGMSVQHRALLRRKMLFRQVAIAETTQTMVSLSAAIVLAWMGFGYWTLVFKTVVAGAAGLVMHVALCDYRPRLVPSLRGVKEFLYFGRNLTGFSFFNYFSRNLDDILVGRHFGAQSLGLYQKAYEMLMLPLGVISKPVGAVAVPTLSRLLDNPEEYRKSYEELASRVLAMATLLGAIMITAPEAILTVVLGEKWAPAGELFSWMGWLAFTQPVGNSTGWLYISQNKTQEMLRWGVIGSSIAVASFFVGLPFGAVGVAAAYSISGVALRTPLVIYHVTRRGPLRARDLIGCTLPFQISALISWGVGTLCLQGFALRHPLGQTLCAIGACSVTMVGCLLCFPKGRQVLSRRPRPSITETIS